MNRMCLSALALAVPAVLLPTAARAQALPTASRGGTLQAGFGGQYLYNDYSGKDAGPYIFVDFDFFRLFRLHGGVEAEARFGGLYSPDDIGENSYLVGPRLTYHRDRLNVYGKILVGRGTIFHNSANDNTSSSFNLYAAGAGVEFRAANHINVRLIDLEQQKWPSFEPHTLSPFAISAGVAYVIR